MTRIVGILNITPDSFSGDGCHGIEEDTMAARMDVMIGYGADIIDIGAESTRPGAVLLSSAEEWQRFAPFMEAITARADKTAFSMDTRHAETARNFIQGFPGRERQNILINDVSGGKDTELIEVARQYNTKLVLTHSLTVPADNQVTIPEDADAAAMVYHWAGEMLVRYGNRIIIDPGIGFGKTPLQSLHIIRNITKIKSLGVSVMVGHSRKSFLSLFTDRKSAERDAETLVVSDYLAGQGVEYLRVHAVREHATMLKIRKALNATSQS